MVYVDHSKVAPVYDENSKVLILESIPSPKSREAGFYYAHPQNRFWRVVCEVLGEDVPDSNECKKAIALKYNIALWDVLYSCDIQGASDGSIKNPVLNDFNIIFSCTDIRKVFATGLTASKLYQRLTGNDCIALPSTSPANCRLKYEELLKAYSIIKEYI